MIETLTRSAATTGSATIGPRTVAFEAFSTEFSVASTRLAAGAALGVSLTSRVAATVAGLSSTPLLVALLALSLLAFVVAAVDPTTSKVDERVATMCRRAAVVQSLVGVVTLAIAIM